MTFTNSPRLWTVKGGVYRYTPSVGNTGAGPVTLTVLQKPAWLGFDGTQLSGVAPDDREGLNELVILRATNGDPVPATEDLSFRIRVGRLVGPVAVPPGGGLQQWVSGMPQVARTGGDSLLLTGVLRAAEFPVFWGLHPNGFGMKMNYVGPSGSTGQDFTPPDNPFSPSEIGQWTAPDSNASGGIGVWTGLTNRPASIGGAPVSTWLRAEVRDVGDTTPLPLTTADELGLDASVGALGRVPNTGDLRVGLRLHANAVYPAGTPALNWFNSLLGKLPTDRTITQVTSGFYWVNTPPRLTTNTGISVLQDGTAVLGSGHLDAADAEDIPGDVRFEVVSGGIGGPPLNGTLQVDLAGTWTPLAAGESFTLAQLRGGAVRYLHGGSYDTSDGFQFRVLDAQNTFARDGDFSVFTFPITITLRNHTPTANNQNIPAGLGSTVTGQLSFSDPDVGYLPQTFQFAPSSIPALGTFTITDPATGSFTYQAGQVVGTETIEWQVSDGEFTANATLTIEVANQNPAVAALDLSGSSAGALTGTVVVDDYDLPAQAIILSLHGAPAKGSVTFTGLEVTYTPIAGRFGSDSFSIVATDSLGGVSAPQTVTVSVRPATLGAEAVFVSSRLTGPGGTEGLVQRVNPANGDVFTLGRNLGSETRGIVWSPSIGKLLVLLEASGSPPAVGLVKVDAYTGAWTMADVVTMNGDLMFPLGLALDGPDHVLVANGPGGVVRVDLLTGTQQVLTLGLPPDAFVVSAVPSPVDPNVIWVTSIGDLGAAGDGALYACNRNTGIATTPVALEPVADPVGLALDGSSGLAVVRTGVPAETIALSPLDYVPHAPGFPAAPWALPVSIAKSQALGQWLVTDPFQGKLFAQDIGATTVNEVVAGELASVFAVTTLVTTPRQRYDETVAAAGLTGNDAEPEAIPFGDGVPNLVKYAFNMNLGGPDVRRMAPGDSAGLPATEWQTSNGNTVLRMEFLRRIGSGLTYTPQISPDMTPGNWQPFTSSPVISPVGSDQAWERVVYEETLPPDTERYFSRVALSL